MFSRMYGSVKGRGHGTGEPGAGEGRDREGRGSFAVQHKREMRVCGKNGAFREDYGREPIGSHSNVIRWKYVYAPGPTPVCKHCVLT